MYWKIQSNTTYIEQCDDRSTCFDYEIVIVVPFSIIT
jgi:hypothetical protein